MKIPVFTLVFCIVVIIKAWGQHANIYSFVIEDVRITIDEPVQEGNGNGPPILVLYALANGNTTEHTMGRKTQPGDDWHFNIQHIRAQTKFVRQLLRPQRIVVAYLENNFKSWPLWKRNHPDFPQRIQKIVDTVRSRVNNGKNIVYLNGHSGGGSFIFGFLDAQTSIPSYVRRISFLDSNYGYDSLYGQKLIRWVRASRHHSLNVFAYNDSVAILDGKPVVSARGGTWYKSGLMREHLNAYFPLSIVRNDSVISYRNRTGQIWIFMKPNPERKILHTRQVEYNGFIHSILCGTRLDSRGYRYYDGRAYESLIE